MVHDAGKFKNILQTLATQHQLMLAYYLKMPSISKQSTETGWVSVVSVDILDTAIFCESTKDRCDGWSNIIYNGTIYSGLLGEFLVLS